MSWSTSQSGHGELVDHVVEEVTAGTPGVEPPAVSLGRRFAWNSESVCPTTVFIRICGRAPDRSLCDELLRELERGVVDEALADPKREPRA